MKNKDNAKILVVDDQIHALKGVSRIMRGSGYEVLEASNGAECLKIALEHRPDLILLDVVLPDIDGREVCRRIKSDPQTADIHVVLLSSIHIESDSQAEGLEHGADGYVARPIPNRELLARVQAILRLKYAESRLRESEELFRSMFERHSAIMLLIDPVTGRIMDAINSAELFYGYTKSQLVSMSVQDFNVLPPDEVENEHNLALKQKRKYFIFPHRLAHGEVRSVEVHSSPIEQHGELMLFLIIHDITDRKRLEEERMEMERKILHAQKLESLGIMAGGIAHDFNNQLAVVLGNLELGIMDQTLDPKTRHSIESAFEAAKRSAELSRQMLVYTGNTFYHPVELDLNELLNKNRDLLKLGFTKDVSLNLESYSAIPPIKGDSHQLQRVIVNLVANASEAIGDKDGDVTIRTGVMDCDEVYLSHSQSEEKPGPGRFVFLEVSDTGSGMDPETQRKLFDPFFSTKFWGRGLGMAEVIGIVKGHQGAILVDSEVGNGTKIRVLFPAVDTSRM